MAPITESMIRRRAEHNDGVMETLEELVLQEEGIDKIETLGRLCPNLKQLFMPNNLIPRIENIHRLKSLEYLNLALNNIVKVDGLHGCEALNKLDLTLNFVDKESLPTVLNLRANIHLTELFLTGNPCTDFPGYRKFVIAAVPSLKRLDAFAIKPSERIAAQQEFCQLQRELLHCSNNADSGLEESEHLQEVDEKGQALREYSVSTRVAEHKEMQDLRGEAERSSNTKKQEPKSKRRKGFDPLPIEGRIYQKNEGGWAFKLTESDCGKLVLLDVAVGRYLDTSLIDVDIHPTLIRILIKCKLFQLKLPCEVKVDESRMQRSTTTGHLVVTFPKVVPDVRRTYAVTTPAVPHLRPKASNMKTDLKLSKAHKDKVNGSDVVNIHHIVHESNQETPASMVKTPFESHVAKTTPLIPCEGVSSNSMAWEDDVPPLE